MPYETYSALCKESFKIYSNPFLVIQSRSSSLPVFALKKYFPSITGTILESCSAPGNKTLQLEEYFPNNRLVSFELNEK